MFELPKWGTQVEIERKRRIDVASWAYAYEVLNESLVDDFTYDAECKRINVNINTGNRKLDKFFKEKFDPSTGMWVHQHPDIEGLKRIIKLKQGRVKVKELGIGQQKEIARVIRQELDNFSASVYHDGHRNHLGASMIGDDCLRKLWYSFRWVLTPTYINEKGEDHKGRMGRLFNRGHLEEIRFVAWLRGMGFNVREFQDDGKTQFRIKDCNGHFGGSLDGMVVLPENYGVNEEMLLEFKTSGEKAFEKLKKETVKIAKPVHYAQMCMYGKHYKLRYALYMCINKNTDEVYVEIVELDHSFADRLTVKAHNVIGAQTPPAKLSQSSAYLECKFCDYAPVCHGQAAYEKSCRSCVNVAPVANGEWHCGLYQQNIPADYIKKGCDNYVEAR